MLCCPVASGAAGVVQRTPSLVLRDSGRSSYPVLDSRSQVTLAIDRGAKVEDNSELVVTVDQMTSIDGLYTIDDVVSALPPPTTRCRAICARQRARAARCKARPVPQRNWVITRWADTGRVPPARGVIVIAEGFPAGLRTVRMEFTAVVSTSAVPTS
jgi:hypothetical protein